MIGVAVAPPGPVPSPPVQARGRLSPLPPSGRGDKRLRRSMRVSGVARLATAMKLIIEEAPSTVANVPSPARRERARVRARDGAGQWMVFHHSNHSSDKESAPVLAGALS